MGAREELQENGRVYREVAANAEAPECCETADGSKIRGTCSEEAEDTGYAQRKVECPASPEDVAAEPPEHGPGEETDVLSQR